MKVFSNGNVRGRLHKLVQFVVCIMDIYAYNNAIKTRDRAEYCCGKTNEPSFVFFIVKVFINK